MATTYLIDTNTFSYIAKGTSPAARNQLQRLSQDRNLKLCISVMTEAEVRFGVAKRELSRSRRSAVESLLAHLQILPWGSGEAAAYAVTRARLEARGVTVQSMDLLIAAQAIAAGATLVTRDKTFAHIEEIPGTVNWATDLT
jgi:tRNA(fMet)-specific endonuclease VapC